MKHRLRPFLKVEPEICSEASFVQLETATGHPLKIYSMDCIIKRVKAKEVHFDLIIMNNDLTQGIPDILKASDIPVYPSMQAGWHSRLKSHHFKHVQDLAKEFAEILEIDPWFVSCYDSVVDNAQIQSSEDRERLVDAASDLFKKIQAKYDEHGIDEKPFVFLKADSGTYGMGVMAFEDPAEILDLNKKGRKKLRSGKGSQEVTRFLLQEGVSTRHEFDNKAGRSLYLSNLQ